MLHIRKLMVTMMFASAAVSGCAVDQGSPGEESDSAAIINSSDDLNEYLETADRSPVDRLSPAARQRFLDSLVFGDDGLGSYSYADLEAELSVSEIHDILSLFGVERTTSMITGARVVSDRDRELRSRMAPGGDLYSITPEDHTNCKCTGTGGYVCASEPSHICLGGC
jgi:hypothetical protein